MKRSCCSMMIVRILLFLFISSSVSAKQVLIEFFSQAGCSECQKIEMLVLPELKNQCDGHYNLVRYDINLPEDYNKLVIYQEKFQKIDNTSSAIVVDRKIILAGYEKIKSELIDTVMATVKQKEFPARPEEKCESGFGAVERRASQFSLWIIAVAGFMDGINPCVFTTLIFFISLLTVSQVKGRKLLLLGSIYCLACFLTYLGLGLGFFRFFQLFSGHHLLSQFIEWSTLALLFVFSFLSFRDAWQFWKDARPQSIMLQLPERLKTSIRFIMRRGLNQSYLALGIFFIGIFVTIIESVCTGQVYIPTLVLLSKEYGASSKWFWYLVFYNLMFIVPLLVIFGMAYTGVTTLKFLSLSRKHVIIGKILLGGFFFFLGILFLMIIKAKI